MPLNWRATAHFGILKAAMAWRLKRGEAVGDGVRRVAREQLRLARQNLSVPAAGRDKGIHEARKSLKRLRAMLRFLAPVMRRQSRLEQDHLRGAARKLSGLRDAAVAIETLDGVVGRGSATCPISARMKQDIARFRASLVSTRHSAHKAGAADALRQAVAEIAEAEARVAAWRLTPEGEPAIRAGLERTFRRGRKATKAARGRFAGAHGHRLRMRVKDLFYCLRLLEGAWVRTGDLADRLGSLEENLGEDHNLAMLGERLPAAERKPVWQKRIEAWIAADRAALCDKAEAIAEDVYREKAAKFAERTLLRQETAPPRKRAVVKAAPSRR